MTDFVEMFRHWHAGRSQVQIYDALGIDRTTIRKYVAPAIAEGLEPAPEELFDEQLWRERIGRRFPELVDPSVRALTWDQIGVHRDWIAEQLDVPVTVATIAQRLRDERDVDVSESTVRRYIATTFAQNHLEAKVTVPRGAVDPGSEAQIDYGKLGMWLDPATGRRVAVWVFAMILSCSRALFIQPVLKMDQRSWNASHVAAFEFFGGVPARLVCDNLKTGVIRPDLYDPLINLAYGELAAFYGALIDPARANKPKDKPRVERPMPYIRDSFWAGQQFESVTQMQREGLRWSTEVYGLHKHRGLDGATPRSVFDAIERDALMPLPRRPFEPVVYTIGTVAPDCHVRSGKAFYSVPWRLLGQKVTVRTAGDVVQIFHHDAVVATHVLHLSGRSTNFEHYPPHKVAHTLRTVTWCRTQAEQIGPGAAAIVAELSAVNAIHRLRAIQGIIALRDRYGAPRLDAACARALEVGDPRYRTVKGILIAGTETGDTPAVGAAAPPAMLRGPEAFNTERTA
ncbi:IS21 family transposase [Mycolicibacterium sp. D5.8-2]|uniref:IS21 family transposase n=1 Tax=Mycolicibacterium sp. D5.8-2 TaxID=3085903 RepID=UPI00298D2CE2|nr:IS21 family transposase [Mycolicibacterium sp. D5.8-2]MDW5615156.1 IS21 family transposase [Mycolicibacterium sp. D5.8-2]